MQKKQIRSALSIFLTTAMLFTLVGCTAPPAAPTPEATAAPVASAEPAVVPTASPSPAPTATPAPTKAPAPKEIHLAGVVVSASTNTLVLRDANGVDLEFSTLDAAKEYADGIEDGDWAVVTYIGTIVGTDTTGALVVKISDTSEHIEKAVKDTTVEPVEKTMYTTAALRVRSSYGTDAKVLGLLNKGTKVTVTGKTKNGWKQIDYDGKKAFVFGDYLSDTKPKAEVNDHKPNDVKPEKGVVYTTDPLRIHDKPEIKAKVIGVAQAGTLLHKTGTVGEWTQVLYDNEIAYCDTEYLTTEAPASKPKPNENGLPQGVTQKDTNETMYTTVGLNLRSTCGMDGSVVASVATGTALHVVGVLDNHWSAIDYEGHTLYCASQYLEINAPKEKPKGVAIKDCSEQAIFTIAPLNMHKEASLDSPVVETVDPQMELTLTGVSGDDTWARVKFNGKTLYCVMQYLSTDRPSTMGA